MRFAAPALLLLASLLLVPSPPADGQDGPPAPTWTREQTKRLLSLAGEYLDKTGRDRSEKDALLIKARDLGPISPRALEKIVKELLKIARSGPKSEARPSCTAKFERFPGKYYLSGVGGGKKGIFVGLHGGGPGVGNGNSAKSLWSGASSKGLIGVFPTANLPDRATTWQSPEVEAFVIEIIKELKRTFRIDTNRIYIAGHSLGGSGAFHIGPRHADWFAGVSPNAGGCHGVSVSDEETELPGGYIANLFNCRTFITHFDGDFRVKVYDSRAAGKELGELQKEHPEGYEHIYIEGKGVSHGFPKGGDPSKIINWLTKKRRDPYPKKVIWEPANREKRLFYWLRMSSPSGGRGRGQRLVATIDQNRIQVTGNVTKGLSVLLSNDMFNPKRPLTIHVNGELKFEGIPPLDPAAVLESILENIDPEQVFTYRIDL